MSKVGQGRAADRRSSKRMTLEEFKTLAREAEGHPERVKKLVKRLVLETLDDVKESLGDEGSEPS